MSVIAQKGLTEQRMRHKNGLLAFFGNLKSYAIDAWSTSSGSPEMDKRHEAPILDGAHVISSERTDTFKGWGGERATEHAVLLDLDVPAWLVESTTPGHSHLYIDARIPEAKYWKLIDLLADCGVIEDNYAKVSRKKGGTMLRLPWVRKGDPL